MNVAGGCIDYFRSRRPPLAAGNDVISMDKWMFPTLLLFLSVTVHRSKTVVGPKVFIYNKNEETWSEEGRWAGWSAWVAARRGSRSAGLSREMLEERGKKLKAWYSCGAQVYKFACYYCYFCSWACVLCRSEDVVQFWYSIAQNTKLVVCIRTSTD